MVRAEPKGEIIIKLPKEDDYQVELSGVSNGWFLVRNISALESDEDSYEEVGGFIHGSILAMDTRNYGNEEIYLYASADENSERTATIITQVQLTLKNATATGDWVYVRWKNEDGQIDGWVQSEWLCGSLVTNCS